MNVQTLVGVVLIVMAVIDVLVGNLLVIPRAPEASRTVLRLAITLGAALMLILGILFLTNVIPLGSPS